MYQVPILQVVGALQAGNGGMEEWRNGGMGARLFDRQHPKSPGQGGRLLLGHVDGHQ